MAIKYRDLGDHKQVNEIVFAGSHDAGITVGSSNAKTQKHTILGQAERGVRFFDIRVGAELSDLGGDNEAAMLRSFHAPGLKTEKQATNQKVIGLGTTNLMVKTSELKMKPMGATWGTNLIRILDDAKTFVTSGDGAGEFIILKFDKCTNWDLIARQCRDRLGDRIYNSAGNLNTKRLDDPDLAGKVVCAFMPEGYSTLKLPHQWLGITPIKNLYKPPSPYRPAFPGIQYWGAGGTGLTPKSDYHKVKENYETQKGLMKKGTTGVKDKMQGPVWNRTVKTDGCEAANPNVLGMMYWTTTGLTRSIKGRDEYGWKEDRWGKQMEDLWVKCFKYLADAIPKNISATDYSSGGVLKVFMPNIVMMDFADETKCQRVYDLNTKAGTELVQLAGTIHKPIRQI